MFRVIWDRGCVIGKNLLRLASRLAFGTSAGDRYTPSSLGPSLPPSPPPPPPGRRRRRRHTWCGEHAALRRQVGWLAVCFEECHKKVHWKSTRGDEEENASAHAHSLKRSNQTSSRNDRDSAVSNDSLISDPLGLGIGDVESTSCT